jgi:hypothetical protein
MQSIQKLWLLSIRLFRSVSFGAAVFLLLATGTNPAHAVSDYVVRGITNLATEIIIGGAFILFTDTVQDPNEFRSAPDSARRSVAAIREFKAISGRFGYRAVAVQSDRPHLAYGVWGQDTALDAVRKSLQRCKDQSGRACSVFAIGEGIVTGVSTNEVDAAILAHQLALSSAGRN